MSSRGIASKAPTGTWRNCQETDSQLEELNIGGSELTSRKWVPLGPGAETGDREISKKPRSFDAVLPLQGRMGDQGGRGNGKAET